MEKTLALDGNPTSPWHSISSPYRVTQPQRGSTLLGSLYNRWRFGYRGWNLIPGKRIFLCGRKSNFICRASKIRVTTQKFRGHLLVVQNYQPPKLDRSSQIPNDELAIEGPPAIAWWRSGPSCAVPHLTGYSWLWKTYHFTIIYQIYQIYQYWVSCWLGYWRACFNLLVNFECNVAFIWGWVKSQHWWFSR